MCGRCRRATSRRSPISTMTWSVFSGRDMVESSARTVVAISTSSSAVPGTMERIELETNRTEPARRGLNLNPTIDHFLNQAGFITKKP